MKDSEGAEAFAVGGDATPLPHQVIQLPKNNSKMPMAKTMK